MNEEFKICPNKNKECISHTPEVHGTCTMSGANRCRDYIHNKTCWSKRDLELLNKVLDNYYPNENSN